MGDSVIKRATPAEPRAGWGELVSGGGRRRARRSDYAGRDLLPAAVGAMGGGGSARRARLRIRGARAGGDHSRTDARSAAQDRVLSSRVERLVTQGAQA